MVVGGARAGETDGFSSGMSGEDGMRTVRICLNVFFHYYPEAINVSSKGLAWNWVMMGAVFLPWKRCSIDGF